MGFMDLGNTRLRFAVLALAGFAGCWAGPRSRVNDHLERARGRVAVSVNEIGGEESWDIRGDAPFAAGDSIALFVLAEIFRQIEAGELDLDERIAVNGAQANDAAAACESRGPARDATRGVLAVLSSVKEFSLRDLVLIMLADGDATATNLLLDRVGPENVNRTAKALGARRTLIARKLGRVAPPENYTTANDLVAIWGALTRGSGEGETFSDETRAGIAEVLRASRTRKRTVSEGLSAADLRLAYDGDSPARGVLVHGSGILYMADRWIAVAVAGEGFESTRAGELTVAEVSQIVHAHYERASRHARR